MKYKFLIIFLLATLSFSKCIGQKNNKSRIRFAILSGVNYQNFKAQFFKGVDANTKGIMGFHGGINGQIRISEEFYFQPGFLFTTKGAELNESVNPTFFLSYVEMPFNMVYKKKLGKGSLMLGGGPYVAYGVSGKSSYIDNRVKMESDIKFTNIIGLRDPLTSEYFKPLDLGANIFLGYEFAGGIFIQLNKQFGMINIYPEQERNPGSQVIIKNTGCGLSLGYRF